MTTRFIVRMLGAAHELLAWVEVQAEPKPQPGRASCPFWPVGLTQFHVEQDGIATYFTVHWPDLDIARIRQFDEAMPVRAGQVVKYAWGEPVWLVAGMKDVPMPAVTVRAPVAVGVASGGLRSAAPALG